MKRLSFYMTLWIATPPQAVRLTIIVMNMREPLLPTTQMGNDDESSNSSINSEKEN